MTTDERIEKLRDQIDAMTRMGQGDSLRCRGMIRRVAELEESPPPKQKRGKDGRFCK